MADSPLGPFALNIRGVSDLVENKTNKVPGNGDGGPEGAVSDRYDALKLEMSDAELLKLRDEYESRYAGYEGSLPKAQSPPTSNSRLRKLS